MCGQNRVGNVRLALLLSAAMASATATSGQAAPAPAAASAAQAGAALSVSAQGATMHVTAISDAVLRVTITRDGSPAEDASWAVPADLRSARAPAQIAGTTLLDDAAMAAIELLPKETPLAFHCHHGGRSRGAADHFLKAGFKTVYNMAGGIDAWSQQVDPSIKRY